MGWALLNTLAAIFVEPRIAPHLQSIFLVVGAIGYGVLTLAWVKADSGERGEELTSGWKFMLVFLGIFALIVYFFKTRGFPRGLLSIVYMIGFAIFSVIFNAIVTIVVITIRGMIFGFPKISQ